MEQNKVFDNVSRERPNHSSFDLSHEKKLSGQMGQLIPVLCQEAVPGDHWSINSEVMLRLSPTLAPIMHRINVFMHYFFVANRLIWDDWEDFITGGDLGTTTPTMPTLSGAGKAPFYKNTVSDYLGVPTILSTDTMLTNYSFIGQLPYRGYHLIWSEYYRDQQLQTAFDPNASNSDSVLGAIRTRAWEKDYFTSSLTAPQKGNAITTAITASWTYLDSALTKAPSAVGDIRSDGTNIEDSASADIGIKNIDTITGTVDVNDLRQAVRFQEWWEIANRAGSRYTEQILAHFGVHSSDSRLQRPEYIGGGRQPVVISEVLNTTGASGDDVQGTMTGHGIAVGDNNYAKISVEEHGYIYAILSILPRTTYQQGVPKHFLRDDKFDYYFPSFAHLGEQAVENRELYFDPTSAGDDPTGTFGYQQRYAEYKYIPSSVHGEFRDTLDYWHCGIQYTAEPSLNEAFIEFDGTESSDRIFANTTASDDKLWIQIYHAIRAKRPMPFFSDPRL